MGNACAAAPAYMVYTLLCAEEQRGVVQKFPASAEQPWCCCTTLVSSEAPLPASWWGRAAVSGWQMCPLPCGFTFVGDQAFLCCPQAKPGSAARCTRAAAARRWAARSPSGCRCCWCCTSAAARRSGGSGGSTAAAARSDRVQGAKRLSAALRTFGMGRSSTERLVANIGTCWFAAAVAVCTKGPLGVGPGRVA